MSMAVSSDSKLKLVVGAQNHLLDLLGREVQHTSLLANHTCVVSWNCRSLSGKYLDHSV